MIRGHMMIWDHKLPKELTLEFNLKLWDSIQDSPEVRFNRIVESAPKQWYWTQMVKRCKCIRGRDGKIIEWNPRFCSGYPEFGAL